MTITRLEEEAELGPDDPALAEIKRDLLRGVTELELRKTTEPKKTGQEKLPAEAQEVFRH